VNVNFGVMKQTLSQNSEILPRNKVFIAVGDSKSMPVPPPDELGSKDFLLYRSVQAGGSAYGFELKLPGEVSQVSQRSGQKITALMLDPKKNEKLGSVALSQGPAYGSAILASVARGWVFASTIAVLFAAAVGWYISRRISAPVLALSDVTARMTRGELSSRADLRNQDEFGQLAQSFNEMAARVEETVGALREFVADAAHELHTPLTALQTNLELAQAESNVSKRSRYLLRAQEQAQRLESLVKSLLDLSRIEAAKSKSDLASVNFSQLVQEMSEHFASRAEQTEHEFELGELEQNISVMGNAEQLKQVTINLLENALKFTPKEGRVSLALQTTGKDAILTISDNGIGIPVEDLPHLFERFHRGRNASSYTGNGLGLAIVKAILMAHGGIVTARSQLGAGTQMVVSIPIYSED